MGCNIITNACNSNECTIGEVSCADDVLKYCGGTGTWIIRTCPYGCNSTKTACNTQSNIVSCTSKGGSCVLSTKCDKKKNHVIYAYVKSNPEIRAVVSCSSDQVCCVANNTTAGCKEGDIECRNSPKKYTQSYELFTCSSSSGVMEATGISCMVSGDKVVYGASIPDGWRTTLYDKKEFPNNQPLTDKQDELMRQIDKAGGQGTREGVAAAALYLTENFGYQVPYYSQGGSAKDNNQITTPGFQRITTRGNTFYTANWGATVDPDDHGRTLAGLDCINFISWAYRAGGYNMGLKYDDDKKMDDQDVAKVAKELGPATNVSQKKTIMDTIKVGDLIYGKKDGTSTHVSMVVDIDYASGTIKVAQSSPGVGGNVRILDMFTFEARDGGPKTTDTSFYRYNHVPDEYFEQEPALLSP